MKIIGIGVEQGDETRNVVIRVEMARGEDFTMEDGQALLDLMETFNGDEEVEAPKPRRGRRAAKAEEPEEVEEEEKPTRRRRRAAKAEEPEEVEEVEEEEKPTRRRRRAAKAEEPEEVEEDEKPKRRRGRPKKDDGPSLTDLNKAATRLIEELGATDAADIIGEHTSTGQLSDIKPADRQKFLDAVEFELADEEDED